MLGCSAPKAKAWVICETQLSLDQICMGVSELVTQLAELIK